MEWSNTIATEEIPSSLGSTDDGPTRRAILNENEILDGMKAFTNYLLGQGMTFS